MADESTEEPNHLLSYLDPLGQDDGDAIMSSLVSSLESSIIHSLRGNIRAFCKNAAELSFFMNSPAILGHEQASTGEDISKPATDTGTNTNVFDDSGFDRMEEEDDFEIIMGSSFASSLQNQTSPNVGIGTKLELNNLELAEPSSVNLNQRGPVEEVVGQNRSISIGTGTEGNTDCGNCHICALCKRVIECPLRMLEPNSVLQTIEPNRPKMVSNGSQTNHMELTINKLEPISISPDNSALSRSASTDSLHIIWSDSDAEKENPAKRVQDQEQQLFPKGINRTFSRKKSILTSTQNTVVPCKRKLRSNTIACLKSETMDRMDIKTTSISAQNTAVPYKRKLCSNTIDCLERQTTNHKTKKGRLDMKEVFSPSRIRLTRAAAKRGYPKDVLQNQFCKALI